MKYYLHDTSAFDDEKISELFINYGYEGLGIFYTALEKMAKQEKPIKTSVLKSQLKIGKRLEKCWSFMEEIELISSSNGESFNKQLLNFSESYQIKKEKTREKVSEWRKRQEDAKTVTSYVPVSNLPKVKESKVKESNSSMWRENFDVYLKEMTDEYLKLKTDKFFINSQQQYYPGIDLPLSLQKCVENFWGTPAGWKNKKKSKTENPDWIATFKNALSQKQNQVFKKKSSDIIYNDNLYKTTTKW